MLVLETDRLQLRHLVPDDLDDLYNGDGGADQMEMERAAPPAPGATPPPSPWLQASPA